MAYLSATPSQNSCTMYVYDLKSFSQYAEVYISCNGQNSPNLVRPKGYTTSESWTIYSLSSGTQYWASFRIKSGAGNEDRGGTYFTTTTPYVPPTPPPVSIGGVGVVYAWDGESSGSINITWSYPASNADAHRVEVYNYYTNQYLGYTIVASNYASFYNLPIGAYLQIKVYGFRYGSADNGNPSYGYITTRQPIEIGGISNLTASNGDSAGKIHISWSSATNATAYRIEVYNAYTDILLAREDNSFTSSTMYGLPTNTYIKIKVYGIRAGYNNGNPSYVYLVTSSNTIGGVGTVTVNNGDSAGKIHIGWSSATNATAYRIEVYRNSTNELLRTEDNSYTTSTMYGLPEGDYLKVKVYGIRSGWSNGTASFGYLVTTSYPVGGVGTVYVTPSTTSIGTLSVSWSKATNATGYRVEVYHNATDTFIKTIDTSSTVTSCTISGLNENVAYKIKVFGIRSTGSNGSPSYGYATTTSFAPRDLTGLTVRAGTASGGIHINWNPVTNATGYRWEIYRGNTTSSSYLVANGNTTNTWVDYTGLAESTLYTVKVFGTRSGYANGGYMTATVTTKDNTPPTVTITISDGEGRMYIAFNATDASGMRSVDTYYTEVSNENGTTYGQGFYSTNKYRTFTADANGREFVHNSYYYMKVVAYDIHGNNSSTNVRVQFKKARPDSWAWHTVKVAGQPIALTAQEWNSFCIKINQFRQYKSLSNYTFSTATTGSVITASIVNQAVIAISAMSPSTPTPATATAGQTAITASFFNTLSSSLNSL